MTFYELAKIADCCPQCDDIRLWRLHCATFHPEVMGVTLENQWSEYAKINPKSVSKNEAWQDLPMYQHYDQQQGPQKARQSTLRH